MKGIEIVDIEKLKFDKDINKLVPEMKKKEFDDLVSSIEKQGQHTPIHINCDNTILDGRNRVKALKKLEINEVKAIRENIKKSDEVIKFVRDTAVERRNLTPNQRVNILLNAKDLLGEFQAKTREKQQKAALETNEKKQRNNHRFGSAELKRKSDEQIKTNQYDTPIHENKELAKLAGVSTSTIMRAKKVKNEAPDVYDKVIKEGGGWNKAYNELPSVKNKEYQKKLKNKRKKVKSEISDEELELIAQSQTLVKRFEDLALCAKNFNDIENVISKALKTDVENIKKSYLDVEKIFSLIGLKIETNGGKTKK